MKNIAFFLMLIVIAACNNHKQPECNSEQVKSLVLEIYKEDLEKYLARQKHVIKKTSRDLIPIETDSIVASFLRNGSLQIEHVMTTEKKKDVFSCECKGDLSYQLSDVFVKEFSQKVLVTGVEVLTIDPALLSINFETNILYRAQLTDDKVKIGVEAKPTEELRYAAEQFVVWYVANELVERKVKAGKKEL